jgi:hypothetical protein
VVVAILWKLMIIMMTQNSYQFVSLCFAFYIMNWLFEGKVIREQLSLFISCEYPLELLLLVLVVSTY